MRFRQVETKNELLSAIAADRARLEAVTAPLPGRELTTPGREGWSVKDHLAHIAAWERMIVAHLRDGSDHDVVGMTPERTSRRRSTSSMSGCTRFIVMIRRWLSGKSSRRHTSRSWR
jgi:hypothetical protein